MDNAGPTVESIERHNGTNALDALTNADTLSFRVTFSEAVQNVDAADFNASGAGDATTVTGGVNTYIVTVSGSGLDNYNGEVGLTFAAGRNIVDATGNALDASLPTGTNYERYTLDNTRPTVASVERHDGTSAQAELTNADTLTFRVTFSEAVRERERGGLRRQRHQRQSEPPSTRRRRQRRAVHRHRERGQPRDLQRRGRTDLRRGPGTSPMRPATRSTPACPRARTTSATPSTTPRRRRP